MLPLTLTGPELKRVLAIQKLAYARGLHVQNMLSMSWGVRSMDRGGGEGGKENTGFAALHTARLHDSAQSGQERRH